MAARMGAAAFLNDGLARTSRTAERMFSGSGYWYSGALYRLTLATGKIRKIAAPALAGADGMARQTG
jgi:hypothetical protein